MKNHSNLKTLSADGNVNKRYLLKSVLRRASSGSGIGLATVARICSRHSGQIRDEAVTGQGATVYFTLE